MSMNIVQMAKYPYIIVSLAPRTTSIIAIKHFYLKVLKLYYCCCWCCCCLLFGRSVFKLNDIYTYFVLPPFFFAFLFWIQFFSSVLCSDNNSSTTTIMLGSTLAGCARKCMHCTARPKLSIIELYAYYLKRVHSEWILIVKLDGKLNG